MTDEAKKEMEALIKRAHEIAATRELTEHCTAAEVGCALKTENGDVFVGVNLDCACGIGFCAEHSAIAAMVTAGQTRVALVAAVSGKGRLLPPCGRCRELLFQVDTRNLDTEVVIGEEETVRLAALLPRRWQDIWHQ